MKKQNVRTLSFIVSTFTYLLIGAAIFDALESEKEEKIRRQLDFEERKYKYEYNISQSDYESLEEMVIKYHPYRTFPQWKFTGAFYFSLTVITTIGYGHSTPQTIPGKIFCMFYAIIGIPLCLVMFQSVGERLNYFASFCIQLIKKCLRIRNTEVTQTEMICAAGMFAVCVISSGAAMFSHYENWTYFDSIYYCVITLTTIGFGDYVALQEQNNLSNITYVILSFTFILFGLTVVASSMNLLVLKFLTMNTEDERKEEYTRKEQQKIRKEKLNCLTSDGDSVNVVNGNLISTIEPTELEKLRNETNLKLNFRSQESVANFFKNNLPFLFNQNSTTTTTNSFQMQHSNETCTHNTKTGMSVFNKIAKNSNNNKDKQEHISDHISIKSLFNLSTPNLNMSPKLPCQMCIRNITNSNSSRKAYYTVRRAPGKISHLLTVENNANAEELVSSLCSKDVNKYNQIEINDKPIKENNEPIDIDSNSNRSDNKINRVIVRHITPQDRSQIVEEAQEESSYLLNNNESVVTNMNELNNKNQTKGNI